MTSRTADLSRQVWAALNVGLLCIVLWFGGVFVIMVILLGTDHSETYVDEWASMWTTGALLGALTALLAGRYDRRYRLWLAPLALLGVAAASMPDAGYAGLPLVALGPLLATSIVLHAWAGRKAAPDPVTRRQVWTGVAATVASVATTPLGIRSPAAVTGHWKITDGSTVREKRTELETLAVRHGWTAGPEAMFCGWRKVVDGYPLCMVIRKGVDAGEVIVEIRRAPPTAPQGAAPFATAHPRPPQRGHDPAPALA